MRQIGTSPTRHHSGEGCPSLCADTRITSIRENNIQPPYTIHMDMITVGHLIQIALIAAALTGTLYLAREAAHHIRTFHREGVARLHADSRRNRRYHTS